MQSGPVRFRVEPIDLAAEAIAPNLNAAIVLFDGFQDGQTSMRHFGIEPELNVLTQGGMVILQRQDVIRPSVNNRLGNDFLTAHGIDRHRRRYPD